MVPRLSKDDIVRAMQKALLVLQEENASSPTGFPLGGEFVLEATPRAWRWKIVYRCEGDRLDKGNRSHSEIGAGSMKGGDGLQARAAVDIAVGRQLPVELIYGRLLERYERLFPGGEETDVVEEAVERILKKVRSNREALKSLQWARTVGLPHGGRLTIRLTRSASWWRLYGYQVLGESRIAEDRTIVAEGELEVYSKFGQVTVWTTVSPGSNFEKLKKKLVAQIGVELEADSVRARGLTAQRAERAENSRAKKKARYLTLERAISEIKEANKVPGTYYLVPWTPRSKIADYPRPYYDESKIHELMYSSHLKEKATDRPRRGAILQIALYPDGKIRTEGWVLDLTPWKVKLSSIADNYVCVHSSHKEGIIPVDGMKFHETLILPDRRREQAWANDVAAEFIERFGLEAFDLNEGSSDA